MLNSFNDFIKDNLFINAIQNQLAEKAIVSRNSNEWFYSIEDNITYGSAYTPGSNGCSTKDTDDTNGHP